MSTITESGYIGISISDLEKWPSLGNDVRWMEMTISGSEFSAFNPICLKANHLDQNN